MIMLNRILNNTHTVSSRVVTALLAVVLTGLLPTPAQSAEEPTVLVTGSNRGIGLELARQYAERGWNVIATARKPEAADDLKAIQAEHPKLLIVQLDVTDHERIDELAAEYQGKPIDILINNAGISGGHEKSKFGEMDLSVYPQVHAVNVVGPTKMAEAFLDSVAISDQKKIINITSGQGSIGRTWGCCSIYRSSKAALNMMMRPLVLQSRLGAAGVLSSLGREAEAEAKRREAQDMVDEIADLFKDDNLRAQFIENAASKFE
jgi:NAD(P)-dependent dehydrogenase (short-subunit alcohol dehydrogenase family)